MMTVLLALERTQLTDDVTVTPHAAAVGESSINLRAGERLTVRDLVEASLIQSANDAAWALAEHVGRGDSDRFVSMMNRRAGQSRLGRHQLRPPGRARRGGPRLQRPRRDDAGPDPRCRSRVVRKIVAMRDATIEGGRRLHTWNDLLGELPGRRRREDRAHDRSRLVRGGGRSRPGRDGLRDRDRQPGALDPKRRPRRAHAVGARALPRRPASISAGPRVRPGRDAVRPRAGRRSSLRARFAAPFSSTAPSSSASSLPRRRAAGARGPDAGRGARLSTGAKVVARSPLVAARSVEEPSTIGRAGWYAGRAARQHVELGFVSQ